MENMINELSNEIHKNNIAKGFYEDEKNIGEMLALIHSEVSEALEADRKGRYAGEGAADYVVKNSHNDNYFQELFKRDIKDTFEDELADIMIRVMDLAAHKKINLEAHIALKVRFNTLRPYKHGKRY